MTLQVQENNKELLIPELEKEMLEMEQEECPVEHFFSNGVYVRQVTLKAGLFVMGHRHKAPHLNIMVQGRILLLNDDGTVTELKAPFMKETGAGRKVAFILEDTVWLNIHATNETNIETLEKLFLDKSHDFNLYEKNKFKFDTALKQDDRDHYKQVLKEMNISEDFAEKSMKCDKDIIDISGDFAVGWSIRKSPIEGKGVFASRSYKKGDIIAPARIEDKRTIIGRYLNHSKSPNCTFHFINKNDIYLISKENITGCVGGAHGDEMTVDYKALLGDIWVE